MITFEENIVRGTSSSLSILNNNNKPTLPQVSHKQRNIALYTFKNLQSTRLDRRARIQFGQVHLGDPTDLHWSKKRHLTDAGTQLTSFDPKNVTLLTRGPTDLLDV